MAASPLSLPLVCERCGADGAGGAACAGGGFHIFADCAGTPPTDMLTHTINLDAPPEARWAHVLPRYAAALRALLA